jgi:pimeloyl-ACP methyl ester carboxylesterase
MRRIRARRVPTLLLWGAGDVWIKLSRAELLQAANPDAKLVVLANAGHCPHDDAPEEASAAMIEFVGSLPPAAPA